MANANFETIIHSLQTTHISEGTIRDIANGLLRRYQEPWRHYHTFEHVCELFDSLMLYGNEVTDGLAVGLGFLYHDAIYDPTASHGRNEELSAQLSESELGGIGLRTLGARVAQLTRATAGHEVNKRDKDLNFFLDADLAILGAEPERYDRYARGIRMEYVECAHVPASKYRAGRISILQGLVKRVDEGGLYRTEVFRANCEEQAQENVAREIDNLRAAEVNE